MGRRAIHALVIVLLSVAVLPGTASSQRGAPLPPLPSPAVLEAVLNETEGAQFFPLRAPNYMTRELGRFSAPFRGVQGLLDVAQTVSYFDLQGVLREAVMPLKESRTSELAPTFQALPDRAAGQVIAAAYDPDDGVRIVVAIFAPGELPESVRFYRSADMYEERAAVVSAFDVLDPDDMLDPVDEGALIAFDRTCVTVGLHQVCWPPRTEDLRDLSATELTTVASERLHAAYDFEAEFDTERAMPDIMGREDRGECARNLSGAPPFEDVPGCVPNLAFAASIEPLAGEPLAIFVVPASADIRTFNSQGEFVGALPAGEYLVLDATPEADVDEPGLAALLFLVNGDQVNHYLIPAVVMQGFGDGSEEDDPRQAAIKDGYASYRGWGY